MNEAVRENLLGFLLDALDDEERREVEELLDSNPQLYDELQDLRSQLEPLEHLSRDFDPPPALVEQTCDLVDACDPAHRTTMTETPEPLARRNTWTLADMIVGVGVCSAAVLMFFPALMNAVVNSHRAACENNLRQIGLSLADFADQRPDHRLPYIPMQGNRSFAGYFAPVLIETGYLDDESVLICPASDLAGPEIKWRVPTIDEIDRARAAQLIAMQRMAAGSYGYNIGFLQNGKHRAPSSVRRPQFVWVTDAPSGGVAGAMSRNHGGNGQNMLFANQQIRFVIGCLIGPGGDDAFRNHRGFVEAGVDRDDAVIAASVTRPFLRSVNYGPLEERDSEDRRLDFLQQ